MNERHLAYNEVEAFCRQVEDARRACDFVKADEIRAYLKRHGVQVEYRADGHCDWRRI